MSETKAITLSVIGIVALAIAVVCAARSFKIVDPGHCGVYVAFGTIGEDDLAPGFHWKAPWSRIAEINVQQTKIEQEVDAASQDLQSIKTTIAVTYTPTSGKVYELVRGVATERETWEQVLIRPKIEEVTKATTAKYSAEGLIKQRLEMKNEIQKRLSEELGADMLHVQDVSIVNFAFDVAFMDAVTKKQIAEQDVLKARNELEKAKIESQRQIAEAEAKEKATRHATDAAAYKITATAEAEKQAQEKIAAVLKANPELMRWRWIEKWDGKTPSVIAGENATFMLPTEK